MIFNTVRTEPDELSTSTDVRPLPAFAAIPVYLLTGSAMAVHLLLSAGGGYYLDEAYMLAAGKYHLDWGYADQPPLVPLLAAAMDRIAPGNYLVLRLPAVLATGATIPLTALNARELGGARRAQLLAACACATCLWSAIIGHWLTPYTIEPALWLIVTWLLARWIRTRQDRILLVLGVVLGVCLQTKFQIALLCLVLLLAVALFGPKTLLARRQLWIGAASMLLLGSPSLLWQAAHGWPQLAMGSVVAAETAEHFGGRQATLTWTIGFAGSTGAALLVYGVIRMLASRDFRFLGFSIVLLYLLMALSLARPYYLSGLYGIGIASGAVGLQQRGVLRSSHWRWGRWPVHGLAVLLALAAAVNLSTSGGSSVGTWIPPDRTVAHRSAQAYHQLNTDYQKRTAIIAETYALASAVEAYRGQHDLPEIHSPHRGYGYFGPPGEHATDVLWVGTEPGRLRPHFTDIRRLPGATLPLWLLSGRKDSWQHIWPRITHLG